MKFFALFVFIGLFAAYSTQTRVKVTILYSALCPDSVKFITEQLSPNYYHLRNYLDIELVPFGKAKSHNNGASFTCEHGPLECAANRIQSCAINSILNKDLLMAFVNCFMKTGYLSGLQCATTYGVEFGDIMYCANTDSGRKLQLQDEKRTIEFNPKFLPTIIYDNHFDQLVQDVSLAKFFAVTCNQINNTAPICKQD